MEYTGTLFKFKLHRPLESEEKANELCRERKAHDKPYDELALTRLNSTFIEIVDRQFRYKGFMTMIAGFGVAFFTGGWAWISAIIVDDWANLSPHDQFEDVWFLGAITAMYFPLAILGMWFVLRESFAYTYYPIRLNRKNRKVYVFRPPKKGGVLVVKWDDVFWHLGKSLSSGIGGHCWDIRGHVLDTQGMVTDTFVIGHFDYDKDFVRHQWEFYRRYMEDGPKHLPPVPAFLNVAGQRERFIDSLGRAWALAAHNWPVFILMLPFTTLVGLGRYFAMITSKIPIWPQAIEDACRIEPGDPFERDARHNPSKLR